MRLFIGIKLDNKALKKVDNYMNYLYQKGVRGNYTKLANIHLTLAFLGELSSDKVDELLEIINSVDTSLLKNLTINKIKMLKSIITLNVLKEENLLNVQKDLINKLNNSGYKLEQREYVPHITLVRETSKPVEEDINIISEFTKITLFESRRTNNGLVYVDLTSK